MINSIPSTTSALNSSGLTGQTSNSKSSTSEFVSSFKEIMSLMSLTNSGSSFGQQVSSGIGDLMGPLLMIILLEKLVEGQIELDGGEETAKAASAANSTPKEEPSGRPVAGGTLTQYFHASHRGLDIGIREGSPVTATMDGEVIYAGWNNQGYGNLVIVQNGEYKTYYAHLSSIPVSVGDKVTAGTTIGLSGNTGNSTGPHLHYEIRKDNVAIDPANVTLGT